MSEPRTPVTEVGEISPAELKERLDREQPLVLVDVREPFEAGIADLPRSGETRSIPVGELLERMHELDRDAPLVLYCRTGGRSRWAAEQLVEAGFLSVRNLTGGVMAWRRDVDPSLREY